MTIPLHHSVVCPILVGRSAELIALQDCIETAAHGQGSVVLLSGEAGIGKSRLTTELRRFAETQDFHLLGGQCFPTDRTYPYAPLFDLLGTFLAPLSPAQIATTLGSSARLLVPLLPEQVQHLPELANLSPLFPLDPEQEQRRLFTALAEVFLRATTTRPLLLVIEDLHWSDESTLEFLLFFARKTAGHRLLVVLTYRNDEIHQPLRSLLAQFDRQRQRQEVILKPLSRTNTETFLQAILQGTRPLPAGMLDALYDLTEGNPFFLEEVLMYGRAIELLRAVGNRSVLCSCLTMRTTVAGPWGGDTCCTVNWSLEECERDLVEALQLARELEWAAGVASAEIFFGGMLASFGQLGAGLAHAQQGLYLAMEMNHQQWVAGAHYTLASIYLSLLAPEQALAHGEIGLKAARALGSAIWITNLNADQIQAYAALGQPKLAEATLQEVRSGAENPRLVAERQLLLAWAELALIRQQPELALLSESIEDLLLREHFGQAAYATLPKEKPTSLRRVAIDEYDGLSEREREVAALIGQGKSNSEIAGLLVVSKRTVETYVSRVLSKLGLTSRSQIALWTRDKGLVSHEP